MKICIFGAGGSARETYWIVKRCGHQVEAFLDVCDGTSYDAIPILAEKYFDPKKHLGVIAIGNSSLRKKIVERVIGKHGPVFISVIDPSVIILSPNVKIGVGAVIAPGCVLTSDIEIGDYCQLNVATSIMHDVQAGEFFTTAPGVRINGKVQIGDLVYFGSNSVTKEEISIGNQITIGAGACVVNDILESGIYVGVPARKLEKKNV
jgi:sugar O-acyltransferase (sialic acid O-acetyltransferase NeuD family)